MRNKAIIEIITVLYIILFLYTAASKLLDYTLFSEQISSTDILAPIAKYIAIIVPLAEIGAVALLVLPGHRLKGLYSCLILMAIFTCYIIYIFETNEKLPCSCGGIIQLLSWKQHLYCNSAFILL